MSGKKHTGSYFWTSYSDLMTNMFFVMLVLFVLSIALLYKEMRKIEAEKAATEEQLRKIEEIEAAIENIDTAYFEYNAEYKKHILKTVVRFKTGSSDMDDLSSKTKAELIAVRESIEDFLDRLVNNPKLKDASYLLVIEGQASKDSYRYNNQLSYDRALALFKFWFPDSESLTFGDFPCEIVIAGSGYMDGKPRSEIQGENQRFLIQIMPKPGIIGARDKD